MKWFPLPSKLHADVRLHSLPPKVALTHIFAIAWCADNETDGALPVGALRLIGATAKVGADLVAAGLWQKTAEGFQLDWTQLPTRSEVNRERARDLARKRPQNQSSTIASTSASIPAGNPDGTPTGIPTSRSDQSRSDQKAPPVVPPVGDAPKKARKKSEVALAADWQPTEAHRGQAKAKGLDLEGEATNFRLHAETHERRCVNWNAAFSMWLNRATTFKRPVPLFPARIIQQDKEPPDWAVRAGLAKR